jgi:Zn-dependent protease/predicted transcriptional regulator
MSGIPVARLFGFEIRVHVSWALILAIIVVSVASQAEAIAPEIEAPVRWLAGAVVAVAFLFSALGHELGHALAARRAGIGGGTIVVYFFGAPATPGVEAPRPRDEVVIGLAGPLVSLAIGVGSVLLAALVAPSGGALLLVGQIALVVGVLNLVLGGINLVPAFPLDGGRVVQGLAWARTGDPDRAMRIAARSGRLFGWALAAFGVAWVLVNDEIDGLMLVIIGWFLTSAARQIERRADLDALLENILVSEVMDPDVTTLPAGLTLDTFASRMLDGSAAPSLPVTRDNELVGVVGASQLRRVGQKRWSEMRAEELMVAMDRLPLVQPETPLRRAFDELRRSGLDGLPVIGAGGLAGVLTRRGVLEALRKRAELSGTPLP